MSNIDPNYEPGRTTTIRVERRSNTAAWWVVGVIAVAAIGVTGYVAANQNPSPTAQQLQATADQALSAAQAAQSTANSAQQAAQAAQQSADSAHSDINALTQRVNTLEAHHKKGERG